MPGFRVGRDHGKAARDGYFAVGVNVQTQGSRPGQPRLSRGLSAAGDDCRVRGDAREPAHARHESREGSTRQHAEGDGLARAALAGERDPAAQARLRDRLAQQKASLAEMQTLELTLPDLTFDRSLTVSSLLRLAVGAAWRSVEGGHRIRYRALSDPKGLYPFHRPGRLTDEQ